MVRESKLRRRCQRAYRPRIPDAPRLKCELNTKSNYTPRAASIGKLAATRVHKYSIRRGLFRSIDDAAKLQRAADAQPESRKHVALRTASPAPTHTPAFAILAPEAKKVSVLSSVPWICILIFGSTGRWPLVFRFIKGAIHAEILLPVFLHAVFTAFVVYLDTSVFDSVGLPSSIVGLFSPLFLEY